MKQIEIALTEQLGNYEFYVKKVDGIWQYTYQFNTYKLGTTVQESLDILEERKERFY